MTWGTMRGEGRRSGAARALPCLAFAVALSLPGALRAEEPLPPDQPTVAHAFKEHGYRTSYFGKWHVDGHGRASYIPPERRQGFD